MSDVYVVKRNGQTEGMSRVNCKDEEKELHRLLEQNHDLLPGYQIRPDDPRRWFLIKREMPVQDPGTGDARWSIDFFFVDQSGIPTFVECKRFLDTRSRREVVAQMLEYAANGHYYWDRQMIRRFAAEFAIRQESALEDVLRPLEPDSGDSVDDFFELVENNLREGQVRLIFFMEEAPSELKSIVDFLNRQMERSEVLIVEAKQYEMDGLRLIVPSLFGYTEQARRVKKPVSLPVRRQWNETEFFEDARKRLTDDTVRAIQRLYDFSRSRMYHVSWGTSKQTGSFSVSVPSLFPKAVFSVYTDGRIALSFGSLVGDSLVESFRDDLAKEVKNKLGVSLPEDLSHKYPSFGPEEWASKGEDLIDIFRNLVDKYSNRSA